MVGFMPPILLIDSGTSTTRVRLVQDGRVQLEIRRAVGAAAGAGGQNAELRQALAQHGFPALRAAGEKVPHGASRSTVKESLARISSR